MPRMLFTIPAIQKIKPPPAEVRQRDYWDRLLPRFGVRVSYTGTKTWIVSARVLHRGEWKPATRFPLGRFPDVSLSEARGKAREALRLAREGKDPRAGVADERAAMVERSKNSYGTLVERFIAEYLGRKKRRASTVAEYVRVLKGPDVAGWWDRPASDITRRDVRKVLDEIVERGAPIQANRSLAYLRKFLNWCAYEIEVIDVPPTTKMKPPSAEVGGERVLRDAELAEVVAAYDSLDPIHRALFMLLLLTGQRLNEIARLKWAEVKGLRWNAEGDLERVPGQEAMIELPGERTKNRKPHVIPLVKQAVDLLRTCKSSAGSEFVFTLDGVKPVNGLSKIKRNVDAFIAAQRAKAGIDEPMAPWSRNRDVRRSVVTGLNELGVMPHVVEAVVNHLSGDAKRGVAGTYNKARYLPERRKALEVWAEHIDRVVAGNEHSNVIAMRSA